MKKAVYNNKKQQMTKQQIKQVKQIIKGDTIADIKLKIDLGNKLCNICNEVGLWPNLQSTIQQKTYNIQYNTSNEDKWVGNNVVFDQQPNDYCRLLHLILSEIMYVAKNQNIVSDNNTDTFKYPEYQLDTLKLLNSIMLYVIKKIKDKKPQYDKNKLSTFEEKIQNMIEVYRSAILEKTKNPQYDKNKLDNTFEEKFQNLLKGHYPAISGEKDVDARNNFSKNSINIVEERKEHPEEYQEVDSLPNIMPRIQALIKDIPEKDSTKQNIWGISYHYCKELDNYTYMEKVYENLHNIFKTHNMNIKKIAGKRRDAIDKFNRLRNAVKNNRKTENFDNMSIDTRNFYKENGYNPYDIDFNDIKGNTTQHDLKNNLNGNTTEYGLNDDFDNNIMKYYQYDEEEEDEKEINNNDKQKSLDSQKEEGKKI